MSVLLFCVVLLFGATSEVASGTDIAKINKLKREAKAAFSEGRYKEAAALYSILIDSLDLQTSALLLNRAHALFSANERTASIKQYELLLSKSKEPRVRSVALNQIGLLSDGKVEKEHLLSFFKRALREDPTNEKARYNYQRIMQRIYEEKKQDSQQSEQEKKKEKDQEQQDKNEKSKSQDQQQKDKSKEGKESKDKEQLDQQSQQQKDNKSKEEERTESKSKDSQEEKQKKKKNAQSQNKKEDKSSDQLPPSASTTEKLRKMNLSEEKAQQILEALRHNEVQYLQQIRRKATRPKDESKPDW